MFFFVFNMKMRKEISNLYKYLEKQLGSIVLTSEWPENIFLASHK